MSREKRTEIIRLPLSTEERRLIKRVAGDTYEGEAGFIRFAALWLAERRAEQPTKTAWLEERAMELHRAAAATIGRSSEDHRRHSVHSSRQTRLCAQAQSQKGACGMRAERPLVSPVPIKSELRQKLNKLERVLSNELKLSSQQTIHVINYVYRAMQLQR